jgi:hypothetical protein
MNGSKVPFLWVWEWPLLLFIDVCSWHVMRICLHPFAGIYFNRSPCSQCPASWITAISCSFAAHHLHLVACKVLVCPSTTVPLTPAYAITDYKCQGQTLDAVILKASHRKCGPSIAICTAFKGPHPQQCLYHTAFWCGGTVSPLRPELLDKWIGRRRKRLPHATPMSTILY